MRSTPINLHGIKPGDSLGFAECSPRGAAIRVCTCGLLCCGGLSHVGIVVEWPGCRRPLLCESTTLADAPCVVQGRRVEGVQLHHLRQRVLEYRGRVWHYPLVEPLRPLESRRLTMFCRKHLGRRYDYRGAADARHMPLARLFRGREDLSRLFCSEWDAACLREVGRLDTKNASAWSPNGLARHLVRTGIVHRPRRIK